MKQASVILTTALLLWTTNAFSKGGGGHGSGSHCGHHYGGGGKANAFRAGEFANLHQNVRNDTIRHKKNMAKEIYYPYK